MRILKFTQDFALYLWQLPQNVVGLTVRAIYKRSSRICERYAYKGVSVTVASNMMGGDSTGRCIVVRINEDNIVKHEYGHTRQSRYLGPLYLFTVGICSLIWTQVYRKVGKSYYWLWCEKWADRLGGVIRK